MFSISVRGHFDAAHFLRDYQGKCENMHGHRFEVVASLQIPQLNEIGIGYDFVELKHQLNEVLTNFDHVSLNDMPLFQRTNPSSENIALSIYNELRGHLDPTLSIASIQIWESPDTWVTYTP